MVIKKENLVIGASLLTILSGIFAFPKYLDHTHKKANSDEGLPNGLIRRGAFMNRCVFSFVMNPLN
jgi:hypothetical protein